MFQIEYLECVVHDDIPSLSREVREKIRRTIEEKLGTNPVEFGKPLQYSLKGCRRLRVGDYRIIYKIEPPNGVLIVKIGHRREVYE